MSAARRVLAEVARRRGAAGRLADGSALLARRYGAQLAAWVRRGRREDLTGWRTALGPLLRLALLAAVAYGVWALVRAVPWLLWALSAGWCWAAWRAAPKPPAETPVEAPGHGPQEVSAEAVRALLSGLIGEGRGVHLSAVLAHLQEHGQGAGWEVADLRARLAALGVPVRRSLKVAGRVAYGVHRDDLPAPSPPEAPGVDRYRSTGR